MFRRYFEFFQSFINVLNFYRWCLHWKPVQFFIPGLLTWWIRIPEIPGRTSTRENWLNEVAEDCKTGSILTIKTLEKVLFLPKPRSENWQLPKVNQGAVVWEHGQRRFRKCKFWHSKSVVPNHCSGNQSKSAHHIMLKKYYKCALNKDGFARCSRALKGQETLL